jgi:hypothetical protein
MRRAIAALVVALALCAGLPAAAHAARAWDAPLQVSATSAVGDYGLFYYADVAVTPQGETVVAWQEATGGGGRQLMWAAKPAGGSLSGATPLGPPDTGYSVDVAADSVGNTYVLYDAGSGQRTLEVRPSGGSFGSAETIDTEGQVPVLAVAPDGDVAVVWWTDTIKARIRPAGGSFGPVVTLGTVERDYVSGLAAALSANGDLAVAVSRRFEGDSAHPGAWAATRAASGETNLTQLSDGTRHVGNPSIAIDDAGRATVVWAELVNGHQGSIREVFMAERAAGGAFGGRRSLARGDWWPGYDLPQVSMRHDGLTTVVIHGFYGPRVYTSRPGEALRRVRSFYQAQSREPSPMASSPSGHRSLLPLRGTWDLGVTAALEGEGPFEPAQDLRRDCARVFYQRLAVGDSGHGAALVTDGSQLILITDSEGTGQRSCIKTDQYNPSAYDSDPYVPATSGPDGGGSWVPGSDDPGPGGRAPTPALPIGYPSITGATGRTTRKTRVVVVCGKPCSISAAASLHYDKGSSLARGRAKRRSSGKAIVVEIPLRMSKSIARIFDAASRKPSKRPLILTVDVTASGKGLGKQKRTLNIMIVPGGFMVLG